MSLGQNGTCCSCANRCSKCRPDRMLNAPSNVLSISARLSFLSNNLADALLKVLSKFSSKYSIKFSFKSSFKCSIGCSTGWSIKMFYGVFHRKCHRMFVQMLHRMLCSEAAADTASHAPNDCQQQRNNSTVREIRSSDGTLPQHRTIKAAGAGLAAADAGRCDHLVATIVWWRS